MNKKGVEFSFNWIFAIIVGAVILFLAIFFATRIISTGRYGVDTELAKELAIITNPLETGFAESRSQLIDLKLETRIYNDCSDRGNFGKSTISATTKSGIGKEWEKPGAGIDLANKYIFSSSVEQGKELFAFSKKFNFPFYVSDLITMSSKSYCFINPPYNIENEILDLNIENVKIQGIDNCTLQDIEVCFEENCEISVRSFSGNYEAGEVIKEDGSVVFVNELIYPAIFSDKEIYECNLKRLMKRVSQICSVYRDESEIIKDKCSSGIEADLESLRISSLNLNSSSQIVGIYGQAELLELRQNPSCEVF